METEPNGQEEYHRTSRAITEVAHGKNYLIDVRNLDTKSMVELRRLLRDLDDRCKELRRKPADALR